MIDRLAWKPILYITHLHNNKVYLPVDMGTVHVDPREVVVDEGAPGSTNMALATSDWTAALIVSRIASRVNGPLVLGLDVLAVEASTSSTSLNSSCPSCLIRGRSCGHYYPKSDRYRSTLDEGRFSC